MKDHHEFAVSVEWTGNSGEGTASYRGYARDHVVHGAGKPELLGSSAPAFRGDAARWNPEEELIAALSACHMLSYLHVAVRRGIVVEAYQDSATGTVHLAEDGGGRFTEVVLHPVVTISAGDADAARDAHREANALCFIANSVAFPVRHEPQLRLA